HDYNEDDCLSTWKLRDWLEERRSDLEAKTGRPLERPEPKEDPTSPKAEERQREQEDLTRRLLDGLPADPRDDDEPDRAKRLLADLLGWHWRELKPGYWEYHQGADVPPSERQNDR